VTLRASVLGLWVLALVAAGAGCSRSAPAAVDAVVAAAPATAPVAAAPDPVVLRVDLTDVTASAVLHRRAQLAAADLDLTPAQLGVQAVLAAATDALVVREFRALGLAVSATETTAAAADRLLAIAYGESGCSLTPQDIKLAYMTDLSRFKHPPSFALWDAQLVCCDDPTTCDPSAAELCRARTQVTAEKLHAKLTSVMANLPAVELPAGVSEVSTEQSGLRDKHIPAFEEAVASLQKDWPELRLRRYRAFVQGLPDFAKGQFRATDPRLETLAKAGQVGTLLGPVPTAWGWNVALLAGRYPARHGMGDPVALAEARSEACKQWAARERQDYRQRLLKGAQLTWLEAPLRTLLGDATWQQLPPDSAHRELPHIPQGL
jgi:hypothetical protein